MIIGWLQLLLYQLNLTLLKVSILVNQSEDSPRDGKVPFSIVSKLFTNLHLNLSTNHMHLFQSKTELFHLHTHLDYNVVENFLLLLTNLIILLQHPFTPEISTNQITVLWIPIKLQHCIDQLITNQIATLYWPIITHLVFSSVLGTDLMHFNSAGT